MTTPIQNKAHEVRALFGRVLRKGDGVDVRAYVYKRWPDLLPEIREQIVEAVLQQAEA